MRSPGRARVGEGVPRRSGDGVRRRSARDRRGRARDDQPRGRRRRPRRRRRRMRVQLGSLLARCRARVAPPARAGRRSRRGLDAAVRGEARRRQGRPDRRPPAGATSASTSAGSSRSTSATPPTRSRGATASIYQVDAVSSATKFSDLRHEGTVGARLPRPPLAPDVLRRPFGTERDYVSRADRRQRVDRPARPQHDDRARATATASTRSATSDNGDGDAARAPAR